jgi:glycosyltransferase involved in cell wall biosynthesis
MMAVSPKLSIVLPVFNKEEYVERTIRSICAQTFSAFELIVIDDGSTDRSADLVRSVGDSRLIYKRQTNRGVAAARNHGCALARTELVAFIDGDDEWYPNHLENLLILQARLPEAVLFADDYIVADGAPPAAVEHSGASYRILTCREYLDAALTYHDPVWTSAAMVQKQALTAVGGFPVGFNHGEDHAVWLRLALDRPVAVSTAVGAIYHVTGSGLTSRAVTAKQDGAIVAINDVLRDRNELPADVRAKLVELRSKFALGHAAHALVYDRATDAGDLLALARGTQRYRLRWWLLRILASLPQAMRSTLISVRVKFS